MSKIEQNDQPQRCGHSRDFRSKLTKEQLEFAEVLGRILCEEWAKELGTDSRSESPTPPSSEQDRK